MRSTRFEEGVGHDAVQASRDLFYDLLRPLADDAGKPALVEMSCFTIAAAPELARIFPEARFVHTVRDGRDSGVSKVSLREKPHHPTDAASGVDFWADRLAMAERGVRGLEPARSRAPLACSASTSSSGETGRAPTRACSTSSASATSRRCASSSTTR